MSGGDGHPSTRDEIDYSPKVLTFRTNEFMKNLPRIINFEQKHFVVAEEGGSFLFGDKLEKINDEVLDPKQSVEYLMNKLSVASRDVNIGLNITIRRNVVPRYRDVVTLIRPKQWADAVRDDTFERVVIDEWLKLGLGKTPDAVMGTLINSMDVRDSPVRATLAPGDLITKISFGNRSVPLFEYQDFVDDNTSNMFTFEYFPLNTPDKKERLSVLAGGMRRLLRGMTTYAESDLIAMGRERVQSAMLAEHLAARRNEGNTLTVSQGQMIRFGLKSVSPKSYVVLAAPTGKTQPGFFLVRRMPQAVSSTLKSNVGIPLRTRMVLMAKQALLEWAQGSEDQVVLVVYREVEPFRYLAKNDNKNTSQSRSFVHDTRDGVRVWEYRIRLSAREHDKWFKQNGPDMRRVREYPRVVSATEYKVLNMDRDLMSSSRNVIPFHPYSDFAEPVLVRQPAPPGLVLAGILQTPVVEDESYYHTDVRSVDDMLDSFSMEAIGEQMLHKSIMQSTSNQPLNALVGRKMDNGTFLVATNVGLLEGMALPTGVTVGDSVRIKLRHATDAALATVSSDAATETQAVTNTVLIFGVRSVEELRRGEVTVGNRKGILQELVAPTRTQIRDRILRHVVLRSKPTVHDMGEYSASFEAYLVKAQAALPAATSHNGATTPKDGVEVVTQSVVVEDASIATLVNDMRHRFWKRIDGNETPIGFREIPAAIAVKPNTQTAKAGKVPFVQHRHVDDLLKFKAGDVFQLPNEVVQNLPKTWWKEPKAQTPNYERFLRLRYVTATGTDRSVTLVPVQTVSRDMLRSNFFFEFKADDAEVRLAKFATQAELTAIQNKALRAADAGVVPNALQTKDDVQFDGSQLMAPGMSGFYLREFGVISMGYNRFDHSLNCDWSKIEMSEAQKASGLCTHETYRGLTAWTGAPAAGDMPDEDEDTDDEKKDSSTPLTRAKAVVSDAKAVVSDAMSAVSKTINPRRKWNLKALTPEYDCRASPAEAPILKARLSAVQSGFSKEDVNCVVLKFIDATTGMLRRVSLGKVTQGSCLWVHRIEDKNCWRIFYARGGSQYDESIARQTVYQSRVPPDRKPESSARHAYNDIAIKRVAKREAWGDQIFLGNKHNRKVFECLAANAHKRQPNATAMDRIVRAGCVYPNHTPYDINAHTDYTPSKRMQQAGLPEYKLAKKGSQHNPKYPAPIREISACIFWINVVGDMRPPQYGLFERLDTKDRGAQQALFLWNSLKYEWRRDAKPKGEKAEKFRERLKRFISEMADTNYDQDNIIPSVLATSSAFRNPYYHRSLKDARKYDNVPRRVALDQVLGDLEDGTSIAADEQAWNRAAPRTADSTDSTELEWPEAGTVQLMSDADGSDHVVRACFDASAKGPFSDECYVELTVGNYLHCDARELFGDKKQEEEFLSDQEQTIHPYNVDPRLFARSRQESVRVATQQPPPHLMTPQVDDPVQPGKVAKVEHFWKAKEPNGDWSRYNLPPERGADMNTTDADTILNDIKDNFDRVVTRMDPARWGTAPDHVKVAKAIRQDSSMGVVNYLTSIDTPVNVEEKIQKVDIFVPASDHKYQVPNEITDDWIKHKSYRHPLLGLVDVGDKFEKKTVPKSTPMKLQKTINASNQPIDYLSTFDNQYSSVYIFNKKHERILFLFNLSKHLQYDLDQFRLTILKLDDMKRALITCVNYGMIVLYPGLIERARQAIAASTSPLNATLSSLIKSVEDPMKAMPEKIDDTLIVNALHMWKLHHSGHTAANDAERSMMRSKYGAMLDDSAPSVDESPSNKMAQIQMDAMSRAMAEVNSAKEALEKMDEEKDTADVQAAARRRLQSAELRLQQATEKMMPNVPARPIESLEEPSDPSDNKGHLEEELKINIARVLALETQKSAEMRSYHAEMIRLREGKDAKVLQLTAQLEEAKKREAKMIELEHERVQLLENLQAVQGELDDKTKTMANFEETKRRDDSNAEDERSQQIEQLSLYKTQLEIALKTSELRAQELVQKQDEINLTNAKLEAVETNARNEQIKLNTQVRDAQDEATIQVESATRMARVFAARTHTAVLAANAKVEEAANNLQIAKQAAQEAADKRAKKAEEDAKTKGDQAVANANARAMQAEQDAKSKMEKAVAAAEAKVTAAEEALEKVEKEAEQAAEQAAAAAEQATSESDAKLLLATTQARQEKELLQAQINQIKLQAESALSEAKTQSERNNAQLQDAINQHLKAWNDLQQGKTNVQERRKVLNLMLEVASDKSTPSHEDVLQTISTLPPEKEGHDNGAPRPSSPKTGIRSRFLSRLLAIRHSGEKGSASRAPLQSERSPEKEDSSEEEPAVPETLALTPVASALTPVASAPTEEAATNDDSAAAAAAVADISAADAAAAAAAVADISAADAAVADTSAADAAATGAKEASTDDDDKEALEPTITSVATPDASTPAASTDSDWWGGVMGGARNLWEGFVGQKFTIQIEDTPPKQVTVKLPLTKRWY